MLDNITKKNIDDCRDVLVGKVPDPKSQIEQITLALIYKFMDDMDKEAVEKFKGKAKFFSGEYAKYGWRKLFDPSLSGQDMLALYSEALEKLNTNPNIPELFRNIFKNAYLPYRDPSTLKLFLKYINEFEYSHSEKLGDAFEYLLSVMGSQGDAGQFRTPRHIIDFVTACVNPQKNETVLDPACGTAGFLLSAYKHILNQNTDKRQGDKLKPDDRKKLATNFVGYDISPDMVRLSLANMYLHGFATPLIHEYDSLSSEDRWQETFDVILANPPFMTPKGGIRPHKKFGVQANKAEVLFTDYIAEHLNSNGRAGIVVPNGIVATSQTAYKQLRKMLVQDSLIAVISLPAGVFQPYSGVKTSVLILDKRLAKKSQHILFLKIENDGFDLGSQRREIDKNDLPVALQTLEAYKESLSNDKAFEDLPSLATLVEKTKIINNKDVNLNADRYFETKIYENVEVEIVKLETIVEILDSLRKPISKGNRTNGKFPYYGATGIVDYVGDFIFDERLVLVGEDGAKWNVGDKTAFIAEGKYWVNNHAHVLRPINGKVIDTYLVEMLNYMDLNPFITGVTVPKLNQENLRSIEIPLPPLEIQQQIVTEIEGYQKIIDGAKQIVNYYKPSITINPDCEMVELGEVIDSLEAGVSVNSEGRPAITGENGILKTSAVTYGTFLSEENKVILPKELQRAKCNPKKDSIIISRMNTEQLVGASAYVDKDYPNLFIPDRLWQTVISRKDVVVKYIHFIISSPEYRKQLSEMCAGTSGSMKNITKGDLLRLTIPLPSFEEQQTIVKTIEEEMQLVNANKRLIEIFEQKIKTKIDEVWGVKEEVETL
jgi:type I restriction enzyme M protein